MITKHDIKDKITIPKSKLSLVNYKLYHNFVLHDDANNLYTPHGMFLSFKKATNN